MGSADKGSDAGTQSPVGWIQSGHAHQRIELRSVPPVLYTGPVMSCLFCKIIAGIIPSNALYQDEQCYAFADINPQASTHVLVVPRKHIGSLAETSEDDKDLLGHLVSAAAEIARNKGLAKGYR